MPASSAPASTGAGRFNTSDPEYYRWTQWLFLKFRERGLAYRKKSPVNWCPVDQTVLANEQVIDGHCERCGAEVTKRELTQWYFKITEYAQELLDNLDVLEPTWPDRVITAQRNWIGRSEGAHVTFDVVDGGTMTVYTTRPDTLFGATFMVVAADAKLAGELVTDEQRPAYDAYLEEVRKASDIERLSTDRQKSGVFLGGTRPTRSTAQQIPIWAADYVLADYGTGAIMAVPGQDQRDWDFAKKFDLPIIRTVQPAGRLRDDAGVRRRRARPSTRTTTRSPWTGWPIAEAKSRDHRLAGAARAPARGAVNFRLRDWLLSRQRYWGAPIPIVHCPACGEVPVPDDQLPVVLPELRGADLTPQGRLAAGRRRGLGQRRRARRAAARPSATATRWTPSSTRRGTSCATARRTTTPRPSTPTWSTRGVRATSTSAAWSTRCCTCCTPASSPWC